jgi:hypothetical protein
VSLSKDHPAHSHLLNVCSSEDGSVVLMSSVFWTRSSMYWDCIIEKWPPLWSSSQSSWLQIQKSGFDSRRYQISWEVVGLDRGPFSLVSTMCTTEELLERKSSGSGLESREYGRRDPSRWPRSTLYPQKLALTSPASGGPSVGIVLSRTQATECNRDVSG